MFQRSNITGFTKWVGIEWQCDCPLDSRTDRSPVLQQWKILPQSSNELIDAKDYRLTVKIRYKLSRRAEASRRVRSGLAMLYSGIFRWLVEQKWIIAAVNPAMFTLDVLEDYSNYTNLIPCVRPCIANNPVAFHNRTASVISAGSWIQLIWVEEILGHRGMRLM
jgi:hypothetical protein